MGKLLFREGFCHSTGVCLVKLLGEYESAEMGCAKMGSKQEQSSNTLHRKGSREERERK